MGFLLTPASPYDNHPVVELLNSFSHYLKRLPGDGAYNDVDLQRFLEYSRERELLASVKVNQPLQRSQPTQQRLFRLRLIYETVNAQLQEQLPISKHDAKSTQDMMTRIAARVTAHSVGMMVNSPVGRPVL